MADITKISVDGSGYDIRDANAVHTSDIVQTIGESETAVMCQKAVCAVLRKGYNFAEIPLAMTDGKFALANDGTSDGVEGSTTGVQRSDFIPVKEGEKYRITTWAGVNVPAVVFYKEELFTIGAFAGSTPFVTTETLVENYEFTIPSGCNYIIINARKGVANFTPTLGKEFAEYIENIAEELKNYVPVEELETYVREDVLCKGEGFDEIPLTMVDGCFVNGTGLCKTFDYSQMSDFIPVKEGEKYRLSTIDGNNVPAAVFFTEATFGSAYDVGMIGDLTASIEQRTYEFTIPSGALFMVVNIREPARLGNAPILWKASIKHIENIADELKNYAPIDELKNYATIKGKTIVNFGDSIFGNIIGETSVSGFLAERTGATVINCGFGGTRMTKRESATGYDSFDFPSLVQSIVAEDFTAQDNARSSYQLPSNYKTNLQNLKDVNWGKVDVITLNYGTNDYTSNVPLEDFKATAIENIGAFMAKYPHIVFVLLTPTWRFWYNTDGTYMEDGTQRVNGANNLVAFCEADKEIASSLNINLIDVYNIGINKYNYSHYFNTTDGTHHDTNGRLRLAEYIGRQLLTIV